MLGPDGLLPEAHRQTLGTVRQMGLEVVLVTARTWADTEPLVRELQLASGLTPHSRLHLFNLEVSKGAALEAYCAQRGIPRQAVIAMGDTSADHSMLSWAGIGVAMGWAPEHVRATADMVMSPDDLAPVSTALNQLLALCECESSPREDP
ncbi:MAG: HAD family hydrolase [Symbiobacteriia bacterium]